MSTKEGKVVVCPQCGKKYKLKAGFSAASFACTACSATVWVEGKPAPAPATKRSPSRRTGGRAGARGGRGRARGRAEEPAEEQEGRRPRYSSQKSNSSNTIIAIAGVVLIAVVGIVIATRGGDEPPVTAPPTSIADSDADSDTDTDADGGSDGCGESGASAAAAPNAGSGATDPATPADGENEAEEPAETPEEKPARPAKTLGGGGKKTLGSGGKKSKYDPPPDLGHLEDTPSEKRKQIDELIALLIDPMAGRDSLEAKEKLVAIGKPAFLPVLGAMAKIRDSITDVDSDDERLLESSLKLADDLLREMDGWLTAKGKTGLKPGSNKDYISYICRLHYKRWIKTLHEMPEMPGPFDASAQYEGEDPEEYRGK